MARIKISMPENVLDHILLPVRITDINYGNHLGNDALAGILHEARVQWLCKHNYSEMNAAGTSLIMADLAIEYIRESYYGDILTIALAAAEISRSGFELYYSITASRNESSITIARAKTGMVCYNYQEKKVTSLPEKLRMLLTVPHNNH